jgi:hypothetical protein
MSTVIIPETVTPEKLQDLLQRGTQVPIEALEHLAEQGFDAAAGVLEQIKKTQHIEALRPLVIMDPDETAFVLMWRKDDEDDPSSVS